MRTSVSPEKKFYYSIHSPDYRVKNLRAHDYIESLGKCDGSNHLNKQNFPDADLTVQGADKIYEVANAFPFRGTTFINSRWADARAKDPFSIKLPEPQSTSLSRNVGDFLCQGDETKMDELFSRLPEAVLLALATTSTDPEDLVRLARLSCQFVFAQDGSPSGLVYEKDFSGSVRAKMTNHALFEAVGNNPALPEPYKQAMVLRPGAQGGSEIVGEWLAPESHVFEYLRRNSYIPWGHFASNMANDSVRYHIRDLDLNDMKGLRHLYYQRTYMRLAEELGIPLAESRRTLSAEDLEALRLDISERLCKPGCSPAFDCTLWGWNYGFDFAPSKYRLNASHQQIHQQFALIPSSQALLQDGRKTGTVSSFACGDLVADCVRQYRQQHDRSFFEDLISNIRHNRRMDSDQGESSLIVFEDEEVMLFVPKAQTSQWELQLMTRKPVGNILEADTSMRLSLDTAIHTAMQVLGGLGVKMVTTIEYAKRFTDTLDQRLIYCFLPKLPESPGAFSEAQLRWIMGHYPEDFACACRNKLA